MLIPTSPYLLLHSKKIEETLNSVKIDFSKMSFISQKNQPFTECLHCQAILTEDFGNTFAKNDKDLFIWICRFCHKQNTSTQLHFAKNAYKYCIQKDLKSKIVPPIILFIIDTSGSMNQSIFANMKQNLGVNTIFETKKTLGEKFSQILSNSKLYEVQRNELKKISNIYAKSETAFNKKYSEQEVSKLVFLYAMIEYNLKNLNLKNKKNESRVGFIFFNDVLQILKANKQKTIPVYVHESEIIEQQWPYDKQSVDFYNFEALKEKGLAYDKYFADSQLSTIDVSKINIQKIKDGGKTALGPALALAMGIISVHDHGSRVIVVTDSMPNYGILGNGDIKDNYEKVGECLKYNGATMSILKWNDILESKNNHEEAFTQFQKKYRQHVDVIELDIAKCKDKDVLSMSMRSLNNLISLEPVGHPYTIKLYCDSSIVTSTKLTSDLIDYRSLRFLNSNSKCWIQLAIKKQILQPQDYLFPIITQLKITYDDIFNKEKYLFMSYVKHHLVKQTESNQSFQILDEQQFNQNNLLSLCDLDLLRKFQNGIEDQDDLKDQLRTVIKFRQFEEAYQNGSNRINDVASIKNKVYEENTFDYESL